jgi:hypothetical protein
MLRASYPIFSSLRAGKSDGDIAKSPSSDSGRSKAPEPPAQKNNLTSEYNDEDARQIVDALEKKRRQLDEEIEKFKSQKEKEFKEFEAELRASKAKRRKDRDVDTDGGKSDNGTTSSPVVNGVGKGSTKSKSKDGSEEGLAGRKENGNDLPGPSLRRRTGSIGELIGSQSKDTNGITTLKSEAVNNQNITINPREAEFQGLFTPSYLPLIDGKHHTDEQTTTTSPSKSLAAPKARPTNRLSPSPSSSFPPHNSATLPPHLQPPAPSNSSSKSSSRSSLSSTSLPSALRHPSSVRDKKKKPRSPKRVLFQLATAIVQPSSSYEEPSPDLAPHTIIPTSHPRASDPTEQDISDAMAGKGSSGSPSQESNVSNQTDHPTTQPSTSPIDSPDPTKTFKRSPTFPPTPSANANSTPDSQPVEESSSYFDSAMAATPTRASPRSPPQPAEPETEQGDPVFDLDEDMDENSGLEKYGEDDEEEENATVSSRPHQPCFYKGNVLIFCRRIPSKKTKKMKSRYPPVWPVGRRAVYLSILCGRRGGTRPLTPLMEDRGCRDVQYRLGA